MTRVRAFLVIMALVASGFLGATVTADSAMATYPGGDGKIAFVRANQIYTMSGTGTGITQLTTAGKNYRPEWSPNGQRISYIHEVAGARDVWVMAADGSSKQQVTRLGNVTSAGATWSPTGAKLAFASGQVLSIVKATAPFGSPTHPKGYRTGTDFCGDETPADAAAVYVDRFLAWSPDGTRIAVLGLGGDCFYDDALWMYYPATQELREYLAGGADCCGYADWLELFWGPGGRFGYTNVDRGDYGQDTNPSRIVYSGFASRDNDTGGAPSPSGLSMAFTNSSSGTAGVFRAKVDGSARQRLTDGYQPDWQSVH
jgi:hypothetical protein